MKKIALLGSTGSVGVNALRVIEEHRDRFQMAGLAAGSNVERLAEQIEAFHPEGVYVSDPEAAGRLAKRYGALRIWTGTEGLEAFCEALDFDVLVAATSGITALGPVLRSLEKGKRVALANKEVLVVAGALVTAALERNPRASLIPVDSEHSAIFQCLQGERPSDVERIILTGSGGPLRETAADEFRGIAMETVIRHPKWKMGRKISVDSATLMNKGMEVIEASWLFGIPVGKIEVLIHPEAVVHSMVEFRDGAILAQLGVTDMRLPLQYALGFPERLPSSLRLSLTELSKLTFSLPDRKKFPCLELAWQAAKASGSAPCVLSAADEAAVDAFLREAVDFVEIPRVIEKVLSRHRVIEQPTLQETLSIYDWSLEEAKKLCSAPSYSS